MAKDVEHFLMYLLNIITSYFESCLSDSSTHLLIGFFLVFNFGVIYIF
jgi:hypothetical protein